LSRSGELIQEDKWAVEGLTLDSHGWCYIHVDVRDGTGPVTKKRSWPVGPVD